MTFVLNSAQSFRGDLIGGLVLGYPQAVARIPDASGVMRASGPHPGRVSVLIGGGSGHYPAFAGLVGRGLATGAVVGEVFTSPSSEQIYRCTKALDTGAGVVYSYGNYGGDVMNFDLAASRARAESIAVETVLVTDDVASAPADRREDRRGIAGGFAVFKTLGAAADAGAPLDEVVELGRRANDRTRTLGVAFRGCTLPGASEPLFVVAPDDMEIGLGIHGEPGVRTAPRASAAELATMLVEPLLAEVPEGATGEAVVVLNGLGATKYEELFVLYREIEPLLTAGGVAIHDREVGELVTSLDMAGCSLTLFWVDSDLSHLFDAPAAAPGYRKVSW